METVYIAIVVVALVLAVGLVAVRTWDWGHDHRFVAAWIIVAMGWAATVTGFALGALCKYCGHYPVINIFCWLMSLWSER
jgi:hypothetical protein